MIIIAAVECELKELNDIADDLYCSLQKYSGAVEEGTRNVLSECLGRTVVAKPGLCSRLQVLIFFGHCHLSFSKECCLSNDYRVRQTQLTTAKYACEIEELNLEPFLNLLSGMLSIVSNGIRVF